MKHKTIVNKVTKLIKKTLKDNSKLDEDVYDTHVSDVRVIDHEFHDERYLGFVEFKISGHGIAVVNTTALEKIRKQLGAKVVSVAKVKEDPENTLDVVIGHLNYDKLAKKLL